MQITEEVQAEIMEILADDQMRHAEFPAEEEMEKIFHYTTQEEIIAANRKSALEQELEDARKDEIRSGVMAEAFLSHPPRAISSRYREGQGEALNEVVRSNAEAAHADSHRHDEQNN